MNKPFLPIAAGDLSIEAAWMIVAASGVLPLVARADAGRVETAAVAAALAVGAAYSLPPVRLKRFPLAASLCVSGVRAAIVNLGVACHFTSTLGDDTTIPDAVWALTAFVLPFSLAIAILKDVPDAEGDRRYEIATLHGPPRRPRRMRAGIAAARGRLHRDGGPGAAAHRGSERGRARRGPPGRARAAAPGRPRGRPVRSRPVHAAATCGCGSCSSWNT